MHHRNELVQHKLCVRRLRIPLRHQVMHRRHELIDACEEGARAGVEESVVGDDVGGLAVLVVRRVQEEVRVCGWQDNTDRDQASTVHDRLVSVLQS